MPRRRSGRASCHGILGSRGIDSACKLSSRLSYNHLRENSEGLSGGVESEQGWVSSGRCRRKGIREKCRAGEVVALPTTSTPAPTAAPSAGPPATPAAEPPQPPKPAARPSATAAAPTPTGAGQFATEAEAKSHCPADIVVWANLNSKIYHFAGYKNYGTTEHGAWQWYSLKFTCSLGE